MKSLGTILLALATIATTSNLAMAQYLSNQSLASQSTSSDNSAYQQGMADGRWDAQHNRRADASPDRYYSVEDQRDYEAGYNRGYREAGQTSSRQSRAYRQGVRDGRWDATHNEDWSPSSDQWRSEQDRRDYETGYSRGYQMAADRNVGQQKHTLSISGNVVSWHAEDMATARVYAQADNGPEELFAEGPSGAQKAQWMQRGHQYTFILRDMSGNELARKTVDLRSGGGFFDRLFGR